MKKKFQKTESGKNSSIGNLTLRICKDTFLLFTTALNFHQSSETIPNQSAKLETSKTQCPKIGVLPRNT